MRKLLFVVLALFGVVALTAPVGAAPGAPNFMPSVYADGEAWGTKFTTVIPEPSHHNRQSFDELLIFTNGASGQLPVAEAAPGNPAFNGGRWVSQTVSWTASGMAYHSGSVPVLMSYDEVMSEAALSHLTIVDGHPAGGPDYFQCPLLPVK